MRYEHGGRGLFPAEPGAPSVPSPALETLNGGGGI
jgi:hypothetical protein